MEITLSDWINIIQTIVLFLTGVVLVWYTIETVRIRKETNTQNTLLAEQVRLMQSARQHELEKEISFIKPYLRFGGGSSSGNQASWEFTNTGGPAKKLNAKPLGRFGLTMSPTRFLDTNEKGHLTFTSNSLTPHEKYPFEIGCQDKIGNQYIFKFFLKHYEGIFEDES